MFWIEIQSKRISTIPSHSGVCFRIIPNQSEKRFIFRLMKNSQKSNRLNPIHSSSIRMNLNQVFNPTQSELGLILD